MSDNKVVDLVSRPRTFFTREVLTGSGTDLAGYSFVMSGQPQPISNADNLYIAAGGYQSSLKRKLKEAGGGLVTGALQVQAFGDLTIPGSHTRIVRHTVSGWFSGERSSFLPWQTAPIASAPSELDAENGALRRVLRKYTANRKVLAGVIAAEFGSSIDSVLQLGRAAVDLYAGSHRRLLRFFRKEDRRLTYRERRRKARGLRPQVTQKEIKRALKRCLDRLSKEWLNISFGIAPLVSDLEGLSVITHLQRKRLKATKLFGVDTRETASAPSFEAKSLFGDAVVGQAVSYKRTTVKLLSFIVIDPGTLYQQALGLELRDLPATVWELLPYSWLVDYFTNASQMIEHYSTFLGVPSQTQKAIVNETRTRFSFSLIPAADSPATKTVTRSFSPSTRTRTVRTIVRTALPSMPIPSMYVKLPTHTVQQANLAALAWIKGSRAELTNALHRIIRHA